jgi:hypothetical protein
MRFYVPEAIERGLADSKEARTKGVKENFLLNWNGCRNLHANTLGRSGGDLRSRSASELLLTQEAELPCLSTVCLGDSDTSLGFPC